MNIPSYVLNCTDFISKQESIVDNQKCQAGFRPLCNKILVPNRKRKLCGFFYVLLTQDDCNGYTTPYYIHIWNKLYINTMEFLGNFQLQSYPLRKSTPWFCPRSAFWKYVHSSKTQEKNAKKATYCLLKISSNCANSSAFPSFQSFTFSMALDNVL